MIENKKAAEKLIKLYRETWIENIGDVMEYAGAGKDAAYVLTGFGYSHSCLLCRELLEKMHKGVIPSDHVICKYCIYSLKNDGANGALCETGVNKETYNAIKNAKTPEELKTAFNNRANHIEKLIGGIK